MREMQRVVRGAVARAVIWDPFRRDMNPGAQRAAMRVQRRWRGVLGRKIGVEGLRRRERLAATKMSSAWRGRRGRIVAKVERVAEADEAAAYVQRCYRGRRGQQVYNAYREDVRKRKASIIQRSWLQRVARARVGRRRDFFRDADDRAKNFSIFLRKLKFQRKRNDFTTRSMDDDVVGEVLRYFSAIFDDDRCALLYGAHSLMIEEDFDDAAELLAMGRRRYPENSSVLYASAICAAIAWPRTTKFRVRRPEILDDALGFLRTVGSIEDNKNDDYWQLFFMSARRRNPRRATILCLYAVATQLFNHDIFLRREKGQNSRLFQRALALAKEPEEIDHIASCAAAVEALWVHQGLTKMIRSTQSKQYVLEVFEATDFFLVCAGSTPSSQDIFSVVPPDEVAYLLESHRCREDYVPSKDNQKSVVDMLLSEVVVDETSLGPRLLVPLLLRYRDQNAETKARSVCAARLIRAYRNFGQRATFRRAIFRLRQKDLQAAKLAIRRAEAALERLKIEQLAARAEHEAREKNTRHYKATLLACVKLIQRRVRVFAAKRRRREEERRRLEKRPALLVDSKGLALAGVPLLLSVFHCGLNYKFVGADLEKRQTHIGYCYRETLTKLIADFNKTHHPEIRPSQHLRILEHLVFDRLALIIKPGFSPGFLSSSGGKAIVVRQTTRREEESRCSFFPTNNNTLLQLKGLHRGLPDSAPHLRDHKGRMDLYRRARNAPSSLMKNICPSSQQQQTKAIAAMRFKMRLYGERRRGLL